MTRIPERPGMVVAWCPDWSHRWSPVTGAWVIQAEDRVIPWAWEIGEFVAHRVIAPPVEYYGGRVVGSPWAFETMIQAHGKMRELGWAQTPYPPQRFVMDLCAWFDSPRFTAGRRRRVKPEPIKTRRIRV